MHPELDTFVDTLAGAQRLVVSTGAGISKESGIPTFREAQDGLWAQYDPMMLATPQAFERNPKLVWDWYQYRLDLINNTQPNAGHHALVDLEKLLPQVVIITQNIDGFHHVVGSQDVISLHGSIRHYKCFADCQGDPTHVDLKTVEWDTENAPPRCPHCQQAYLRPDVVWFNESLPHEALKRAFSLAASADVMLVIGTSGVVQPAATLPYIAQQSGATILEINPAESGITPIASIHVAAASGEVMPIVVEKLKQRMGP
jgi:NAD-dependent deacetylase